MKKRTIAAFAIVLTGLMLATSVHAEPWWWSVGPVYRGGMEMEVSGHSYVQEMNLHAINAASATPASVGPAGAFADRTYDDGFVRIDPGTEVDGLGLTWYWRYEDAGQFSAAADTLSYHAVGGARQYTRATRDEELSGDDDLNAWGVAVSGGRDLLIKEKIKVGVAAGLRSLWGLDGSVNGSPYAEDVVSETFRVVDVYALEGVIPPPAPYEGTYDGPGPVIPNVPTVRAEQLTGGSTWSAHNNVKVDLDGSLQELWIGPRVEVQAGEGLEFHVTPFVSVNYLSVDLDRREDFLVVYADGRVETVQSWRDSRSEEEWLMGAGVSAGGRADLGESWFAEISASYNAVEDADFTIGPNKVNVDVSGYSIEGAVGRDF